MYYPVFVAGAGAAVMGAAAPRDDVRRAGAGWEEHRRDGLLEARSVSRLGESDLGVNARRLERLANGRIYCRNYAGDVACVDA